jgi:hypothetical protein
MISYHNGFNQPIVIIKPCLIKPKQRLSLESVYWSPGYRKTYQSSLYVKNVNENPSRTHDLVRLAEKAGIATTEEQKDTLDLFTMFNINVRYPDYELLFYKKCDYNFATKNIKKMNEVRVWLLTMIGKE